MTTIILAWLIIAQPAQEWVGTALSLFQLIIGGYIAADSMTKGRG